MASVGNYGLAIFNGIMTSIMLETMILIRQMALKVAFKTAIGMSLISMIAMEAAMNITDVILTGGAILKWWVIPIMLIAGFIAPLPYNYWRLKALKRMPLEELLIKNVQRHQAYLIDSGNFLFLGIGIYYTQFSTSEIVTNISLKPNDTPTINLGGLYMPKIVPRVMALI